MIDLSSLPSFPEGWAGPKFQPSNHVVRFLVTSPHSEAIRGPALSHLISIIKTLLSLRKSERFLKLCAMNKVRYRFNYIMVAHYNGYNYKYLLWDKT